VVLLQGVPEKLLGQRGQSDPLEAGQPTGQLGVEQPARAQAEVGEAGQVLAGGVQHPLGVGDGGVEGTQVAKRQRVDEHGAGAAAP
jgi:hypothetical protein